MRIFSYQLTSRLHNVLLALEAINKLEMFNAALPLETNRPYHQSFSALIAKSIMQQPTKSQQKWQCEAQSY